MRRIAVSLLLLAGTTMTVPVLSAQTPDPAHVKRGQELYTAQKCQMCHSIDGKGNKVSPLDGVGSKLSAEEIKAWIVTPVQMTAKTKSTKKPAMPNRYDKLPAADVDALVAYMQSLKKKG